MSVIIEPTIGRRVWYYPSDFDRGLLENKPESVIQSDGKQPCDAGVVYVHSNTLVNLSVTDHNGFVHRRTSVELVQPNEPHPTGRAFCTWVPYQVAKACSS